MDSAQDPVARQQGAVAPFAAWLVPLVLFIGVFVIYAVTAARHEISIDAHAASVEAWKIGTSGTPWLTPHDLQSLPHDEWLSRAPNGHIVAQRMAGPVLAGVPFYWVAGHLGAAASFNLLPAGLAAAAFTAGTVTLMFLALRRNVPAGVALAGSLTFAIATPTWSVSADGLWTHTVTQFGIAGAAYAFAGRRWWLAGCFLSIGMLGRPHVALIAATVGLGIAWLRRQLRPALGLGVPTVAALGAIELWNHFMFGPWTIGGAYGDGRLAQAAEGYGGSGSGAQILNYLGFLVSPNKGLFVWTPALLLLFPALYRSWHEIPDWSRWLLVGGLLYSFFQLRLNYFAGGDTFYGYRHGLELLTCITPAVTFSLGKARGWARALLPPILGAQFAAFSIGAVSNTFYLTVDKVWVDNSFCLALRTQPAVTGGWLVLCIGGALLTAALLCRRAFPHRTRASLTATQY